jgi:branched-subunit amino acid aminotransferase/4-amino-4-deoxychorismate lyase
MEFKFFSRNGVILPVDQAQVPLSFVEYSYGFGVYETIRYSKGVLYFLKDHAQRLMESARIIELEHEFSAAFVERSVLELVERTQSEACNLKILLIGGPTAASAQLFILCLNPLFPDRKLYRDGASVICVELERTFPHAKTLNMMGSYLAYRKARKAGAYDALLVNTQGNITEGTRTNFFCIRGKTIYSPPESDILLGVTRKAMTIAALNDGYELVARKIRQEDLGEFDGAFVTSTSSKIVPIRSVGDHVLNDQPPEMLSRLMDIFGKFLADSKGVLE